MFVCFFAVCLSQLNCLSQNEAHINLNIDIDDCYFSRTFSRAGKGGVVSVINAGIQMKISQSVFYNCSANDHGGVIWFVSQKIGFYSVCAFNCFTSPTYRYEFGYIDVSDSTENHYSLLSLAQCPSQKYSDRSQPCQIYRGNQMLYMCNSSDNCVDYHSGFVFVSPKSLDVMFSTFSNNKGSNTCLYVSVTATSGSYYFKNLNVFNNYQSKTTEGVFYINTKTTITFESCLLSKNNQILFFVFAGSVSISHSLIQHIPSKLFSGSLIYSNNVSISEVASIQSYNYNYYSPRYCYEKISSQTIRYDFQYSRLLLINILSILFSIL